MMSNEFDGKIDEIIYDESDGSYKLVVKINK
jgi:hypothetical protein